MPVLADKGDWEADNCQAEDNRFSYSAISFVSLMSRIIVAGNIKY